MLSCHMFQGLTNFQEHALGHARGDELQTQGQILGGAAHDGHDEGREARQAGRHSHHVRSVRLRCQHLARLDAQRRHSWGGGGKQHVHVAERALKVLDHRAPHPLSLHEEPAHHLAAERVRPNQKSPLHLLPESRGPGRCQRRVQARGYLRVAFRGASCLVPIGEPPQPVPDAVEPRQVAGRLRRRDDVIGGQRGGRGFQADGHDIRSDVPQARCAHFPCLPGGLGHLLHRVLLRNTHPQSLKSKPARCAIPSRWGLRTSLQGGCIERVMSFQERVEKSRIGHGVGHQPGRV
mmetsp:Transcript_609/g.1279  ORF Transcript_609/g.1279 Transcript_609/m.1279 type:complete len:292 (+) Transcript_609:213-1088(+)